MLSRGRMTTSPKKERSSATKTRRRRSLRRELRGNLTPWSTPGPSGSIALPQSPPSPSRRIGTALSARSTPSLPSRSSGVYEARRSPSPAPTGRGGSMFSGFVQGMALGFGDAVAHRAVDALMGPRRVTIRNEAAAAASPTPAVPARPAAAPVIETMASTSSINGSDACSNHSKAFQDCIDEFVSDISKCQWYMDKLYECKKNSGTLNA